MTHCYKPSLSKFVINYYFHKSLHFYCDFRQDNKMLVSKNDQNYVITKENFIR